jgi:hypothetical protein
MEKYWTLRRIYNTYIYTEFTFLQSPTSSPPPPLQEFKHLELSIERSWSYQTVPLAQVSFTSQI